VESSFVTSSSDRQLGISFGNQTPTADEARVLLERTTSASTAEAKQAHILYRLVLNGITSTWSIGWITFAAKLVHS
jgi:hypothetical protein